MIGLDGTMLPVLSLALLDLCAASVVTPFLPVIAENLGANTLQIGIVSTVYGVVQVIFAPLIGQLSDNNGRKASLQLGFAGSCLTALLILIITSLNLHFIFLYLAILPMAMFRHSQGCIKSLIADKSNSEKKSNTSLIKNENNIDDNNESIEDMKSYMDEVTPKLVTRKDLVKHNIEMKKKLLEQQREAQLKQQKQKKQQSTAAQKSQSALNYMAQWSCACYVGTIIGPLLTSLCGDSTSRSCLVCFMLYAFAIYIARYQVKYPDRLRPIAKKATSVLKKTNAPGENGTEDEVESLLQNVSKKAGNHDDSKNKSTKNDTPSNSSSLVSRGVRGWQYFLSKFEFPNSKVRNLVIYHFCAYFALNMYRCSFVLILKHRFGLEKASLGYVMSYQGAIGFIIQLYLSRFNNENRNVHKSKATTKFVLNEKRVSIKEDIKKKTFTEYQLLFRATLMLGLSMVGYGIAWKQIHILIILVLQEAGTSLFRTSFHAVFSKEVE